MKKLVLALVAIALVSMSAGAQTGKRRSQNGTSEWIIFTGDRNGRSGFYFRSDWAGSEDGQFRRAVSKRSSSRCSRI